MKAVWWMINTISGKDINMAWNITDKPKVPFEQFHILPRGNHLYQFAVYFSL